jgi:hypothetical protein
MPPPLPEVGEEVSVPPGIVDPSGVVVYTFGEVPAG